MRARSTYGKRVDGVTKRAQRLLTVLGWIFGLAVGFFVFQKVIGNKMIEAPKFVLAVFIGGFVGMIVYTFVKDGGAIVLKRAANANKPRRGAESAPVAAEPRADAAPATKPKRTEPLRAAPRAEKRKEPLRAPPRQRPIKKR
jgi:hypothetical protein